MWPEKVKERGGVALGHMVWPPTPTIGDPKREVTPQNSLKSKKVAPVSRRNVIERPSTVNETLGS